MRLTRESPIKLLEGPALIVTIACVTLPCDCGRWLSATERAKLEGAAILEVESNSGKTSTGVGRSSSTGGWNASTLAGHAARFTCMRLSTHDELATAFGTMPTRWRPPAKAYDSLSIALTFTDKSAVSTSCISPFG